MILPNFLGIGAMRSGTTWLDQVLRSHPEIYLPEKRKEIHFFDQYYERGINWYQNFFPEPKQANLYQAIGEITPKYLYSPQAPKYIHKHLPSCRFLIILRNPADRAYSQYGFAISNFNEQRSFPQYLAQESEVFERGLYSQQINNYLQYFTLDQFLILIYEQVVQDPEVALTKIADFLSVDSKKFDLGLISKKVNSSGQPYFSSTKFLAVKVRDFLRNQDLDFVWNMAKNSGLSKILTMSKPLPGIEPEIRSSLLSKYVDDINNLESLIQQDLSVWK